MTRSNAFLLLSYGLILCLMAGCAAPWRALHEGDRWTLYAQEAGEVDVGKFEIAVDTGRAVVEQHFGPFEEPIRVYAWTGGASTEDGTRGNIEHDDDAVQDVPGIGPARVQAFYAKRSGFFGERSGVFLGQPDIGSSVHELVHARLAERSIELPLWLEEGLAMVLGDGALFDGKWEVDGLACWPLRELSEESLNDAQLDLLLTLKPGVRHNMRTNVLVHFLGWSIVFDLYRETGSLDWETWSQRYSKGISVAEARTRMNRTLKQSSLRKWLARLESPNPAVRLACARGLWKLKSRDVADHLVRALRKEQHPEVAASLTVNLLATAAEINIGRRNSWRMRSPVGRVLRDSQVDSARERKALRVLYEDFRYYGQDRKRTRQALDDLSRFLEE